jgi:hypothetical protein
VHRPPTPESRRAEIEGLVAVGAVLLIGFMGSVLFAASVGLVESDDTPGVFARIVMFCFGGTMFLIAGFIGWRMTAELVGRPPKDYFGILWEVTTRTFGRIELRSCAAAAMLAPLVYALFTPHAVAAWWRPSAEVLMTLMPLEFLVIHGFPFLVFLALLVRGSQGIPRWCWIGVMLLLILMYGALAWQEAGGLLGVLALLWLITPNILAFGRAEDDWHLRVAAVTRWVLRFVVFAAFAILLDERSLRGEGNIRLGAAYFSAILLLELFRIFELPLDIADQWSKIPGARRSALLPPST